MEIDFHVGPPGGAGVGVEVKMRTSNAEIQRAFGQVDQYCERYGSNLLLILLADFMTETQKQLFLRDVKSRGVETRER
jgi:hypothetical protein